MKLVFVSHGRAGKDTALEYLASITNLRNAGTTSKYLARFVAKEKGLPVDEVYRRRHEDREFWFQLGNKIRENDPGLLLREAFEHGDMTGGIRDMAEAIAARKMADLVIWIENIWVPNDPTLKFSAREADIIIPNNWGLPEYHERLFRFAKTWGLLKEQQ